MSQVAGAAAVPNHFSYTSFDSIVIAAPTAACGMHCNEKLFIECREALGNSCTGT